MRTLFVFLLTIYFMSTTGNIHAQSTGNVFTFKVGLFELTLLSEGQGQGNKGVLVGATDKMLERYAPDGTFPNATNAFFLKTPDMNILIDAGYGRNLFDNLQSIGITPDKVDVVLLTHMHGDHIGGMLREGQPSFPNAEVYLSQPEHDYWATESRGQQARDVIAAYKGKLHLFKPVEAGEQGQPLVAGISGIAAYGHTPGHVAYLLESDGERLMVWGDLTHAMAIQMPCPQVAVTYDVTPADAIAYRKKILEYVETNRIPVAGMHIAFPGIGAVTKDAEGYAFRPATR
ncbi:MAG: MBL fold metallo-hydrolase [Tannerellaceae bacterium]|jgi:glyoxylase-like metal-dependent hydrolase (beta-lactamase superfamily II)|nr:MBL fold metallo-hydrolase [Tannerellaceae bacterium]